MTLTRPTYGRSSLLLASSLARGNTGGVSADNELLERVRSARRSLADGGPAELRAENDFGRVSLPDSEGDVLRDILAEGKARVVIEIGLAYGASALAVAEAIVSQGIEGADHVIIDAFQEEFHDARWDAIVAAGLTEVCRLLRERSQLVLPRLLGGGFVADAAFVDGSHIFHNVFVDLFFLRELVRPGGLVVLDDCQWPSVATAVRYFELNTGWTVERFDRETRLRAYRLPSVRVEPSFESFRWFGVDRGS